MSDLVKVAIAALRKAEVEMRYAGWSVFQSDNIGRFDAMKQVLDAIHFLRNCEGQMKDEALPSDKFKDCVATPNQAMNMANVGKQQYPAEQSGQLTGGFGWYKSGESKDYDPKGLYITQTPVPQLATDCTRIMREQGKPYPRTCPRCGLGPCAYIPLTTVQKLSMNQDAAGLLHDKAHTDTGKTRAAQSVRTPEMSYRPGSLRMEDAPVAKKPGTGLFVECNATLHDYDINGFPSRIPFEMKPITLAYEGLVVFTPGKLMEVVRVYGSVVIVKQAAPLRELSNEEIKDIELSLREYYDNDRYDLSLNKFARAIIDAARRKK